MHDDNLRERLLRVQDLNLEGSVPMCRATETTKERIKEIKLEEKEILCENLKPSQILQKETCIKILCKQRIPKEKQDQCKRCGEMHGKDCPGMDSHERNVVKETTTPKCVSPVIRKSMR